MTPNQRGAIAEAAIIKVAVELGVIVSRPVQDAPYDLVFDLRERLMRVQCKWAVRRDDVANHPLRTLPAGPKRPHPARR